ncbi:alcohol dehydrogenase catalytic domain-containing protein [Kineococcus sp. SYSU DK001]|uniref:alcohol dehydrogenase catalytic domain-containing protein n=1 Tax=Kineococcus sp. SYSU DK001 TaxID=3383122 RepID=UPI003D7F1674
MDITGAVLREMGAARPYGQSRPIDVVPLRLDPPGEGEVLVRVEVAGLCHSDLSVIEGNRPRPMPMLLGHEAAGIVEEVGPGVPAHLLGRRVATTFLARCGACPECRTGGRLPCREGSATNAAGTLPSGAIRLHEGDRPVHHHLGVSGFATHAVLDRRSTVLVDEDVPAAVAALSGCALLTGGGAVVNAAQLTDSDSLAVVGLGGVGMAALLTALAVVGPGGHVVGVDQNPDKLAVARAWGAHEALTPDEARERGTRVDVVIEAAGHPRAFETGLSLLASGGRLVTVGLPAPGATAQVEPLDITARALSIVGSYQGSAVPERDIPLLLDLWRAGRLPVERLATATNSLTEVHRALDRLASGQAVREMILPGTPAG